MRHRRISAFVMVSSALVGCAFWDMGTWTGAEIPLEAGSVDTAAPSDSASDVGGDAGVDARVSYYDTVMEDHPLAYWPLDDLDASMPLDVSGNHVQTTLVGNVRLVRDDDARGGRSAYFAEVNNQGGRIDVVDSGPFGFFGTTDYSIEAWAKPNPDETFTNGQIAIHAATDESLALRGYGLSFDPPTRKVGADRYTATGKHTVSSSVPATAPASPAYVHLVVTYDASTSSMSLYVNGTWYGPDSDPSGIGAVPTTFSWGGWAAGASDAAVFYVPYWYFGNLDELAIYDSVLSPARVLAHYTAGKQ